jgi:hypothetical protein
MKLPVQAPAVVGGGFSWPTRRLAHRGGTVVAIEPAGGSLIHCEAPTPYACVCDNGVATCCETTAGCTVDTTTGACNCLAKKP